ncbi:MAG: hypothetical protein R8N50_03875 [Alphaproteobacteria bacterium]|nr:hypothetical protein [Alphaproteobacteria bacterium]
MYRTCVSFLYRFVAVPWCAVVLFVFVFCGADAALTSKGYVDEIVNALGDTIDAHTANVQNPHGVTASQIGLGNVQNLDQTNADNLSSGTVSYERLPVGSKEQTVAAGNDVRFDTIPTVAPSGTPPEGQVFIWFN